jgi:putative FmdB family regulatory protein
MPIYEYACEACGHEFETLVLGETKPECPSCQSRDLERLLSLPTVHSSSTRALSMKAAKKRDKAQATERVIEQQKYEQSHND